jgi:hypothetical protein
MEVGFHCPRCNQALTPGGREVAAGLSGGQKIPELGFLPPHSGPPTARRAVLTGGEKIPELAPTAAEPWFYRFIDMYAKLAMWLGILVNVFALLLYLGFAIMTAKAQDSPWVLVGIVPAFLACGAAVLGVSFSVALILVAVDFVRTVRDIRELLRNPPDHQRRVS